jgi:uncharacterized protein (DUF3084 family)
LRRNKKSTASPEDRSSSKDDLPELSPDIGVVRNAQTDHVSQRLEQALETTKAQLRETIEQSEISTEELIASNEELQASREELNSINQDLTKVNHELNSKLDQLGRANSACKTDSTAMPPPRSRIADHYTHYRCQPFPIRPRPSTPDFLG